MQNLAYALRVIRKAPGFSILVILMLALGIGANTAVFTLVNAALLRPLPFHDPSSLVSITTLDRRGGDTNGCLSYPHFQLIAGHGDTFSSIAAYTNETFSFSTGKESIAIQGARVSWNFLDVLGVMPLQGRDFTAQEGKTGRPVALISYELWQRQFGKKPSVLGRSFALDSRPYTVIGVLPDWFQFGLLGTDIDVWIRASTSLILLRRNKFRAVRAT